MATKLENLPLEIAHFENFVKYVPQYKSLCSKTIKSLLEFGHLQVSTVFEEALAAVNGTVVISTNAADLSDGSDAKLSSVRTSGYGKNYGAPVTSIYNKTGALRVQVYERKQNKFYYFVIPRSAYSHIGKTSNIEIPFQLDGTPRRINRAKYENWWDYEVASFNELSLKK